MSPPLNVSDVKRCFGDVKHFSYGTETPRNQTITSRLQDGARVREPQNYRERSTLEVGNTSGRCKGENVISIKNKAVAGLGVRVAPLGAVVTSKVRIINDLSLDPITLGCTKGGLDLNTVTQDILRCLCGEALPKLLAKISNSESSILSRES